MAQLVHRPCHWFPALFLLWMAPGYMGLYFYAQDYASWVANVVVFRKTTVVKSSGWLEMNLYVNYTIGRALYPKSFQMQNYTNGSLSSFNTSFVFSMNTSLTQANYGDGLTFLMCPSRTLGADQVASGGYLGLFNNLTVGKPENKVFAVEFDTRKNDVFKDPNDNHIGIDLNNVISNKTVNLANLGIYLNEGKKVVCWVDYDGQKRYLRVYVAYSPSDKPLKPALNWALDLAPYTNEYMYVGFTSATGIRYEQHRVYSWWFLSGFGNLSSPLASSSTSNFTPSSTSSSTPSSTSSSTPSSPSSSTPSSTSSSTPSSPSSSTSSSPSSSTPSSTSSSTPSSPSSSTPSPPSSFTPSSPSSSTPSPPSSFTPSSSSSGASSKSSSLLARLGQKKIVIGVFSSTLVISFLFFCCICAWCQWRRRSKHFIDILLPVACWMLWKETITSETRSTRCLKLLTPTVELLAWLWRTRLIRKVDQSNAKVWQVMFLKRKIGSQYTGDAWQSKKKRQKWCEWHDVTHDSVPEELSDEDGCVDESPNKYIIQAKRYVMVDEKRVDSYERRGSFLITQGGSIANVEVLDADENAKILKRRGSFLLPQGIVIESEELKEAGENVEHFQRRGSFVIPEDSANRSHGHGQFKKEVITPNSDRTQTKQTVIDSSESESVPGYIQPSMETVYISATDDSSRKFTVRRGSFLLSPEDDIFPYKVGSISNQDVGETSYALIDEPYKEIPFQTRRGSFLLDGDEVAGLAGMINTGEMKPSVQHVVEHGSDDHSKRRMDVRRGSFMIVDDTSPSKAGNSEGAQRSALQRGHLSSSDEFMAESRYARGIDVRRGSFVFVPDTEASPKEEQ